MKRCNKRYSMEKRVQRVSGKGYREVREQKTSAAESKRAEPSAPPESWVRAVPPGRNPPRVGVPFRSAGRCNLFARP